MFFSFAEHQLNYERKPNWFLFDCDKKNMQCEDQCWALGSIVAKELSKHKLYLGGVPTPNSVDSLRLCLRRYCCQIELKVKRYFPYRMSQQTRKIQVRKFLASYYADIISSIRDKELLQILLQICKEEWGLNRKNAAQFVYSMEMQMEHESDSHQLRRELIRFSLDLFQVSASSLDYGQLLLNKLHFIIRQLYLMFTRNYSLYLKTLFQTINNNNDAMRIVNKAKDKQALLVQIFSQLTMIKHSASKSHFLRKLLTLLVLLEGTKNLHQSLGLTEIIQETIGRLLYALYSKQLSFAATILTWLLKTTLSLSKEMLRQSILPHLLVLYQLMSILPVKMETEMELIHSFMQRLTEEVRIPKEYRLMNLNIMEQLSGLDFEMGTLSATNSKRKTPTKQSLAAWRQRVLKQIKNCNFNKLYLLVRQLKYDKEINLEEARNFKKGLLMNSLLRILRACQDNYNRYQCTPLMRALKAEVLSMMPQAYSESFQFQENMSKYKCLYFEIKDLKINTILEEAINLSQHLPISTLHKVRQIAKKHQEASKGNIDQDKPPYIQYANATKCTIASILECLFASKLTPAQKKDQSTLSQLLCLEIQQLDQLILLNLIFLILGMRQEKQILAQKCFGYIETLIDSEIHALKCRNFAICELLLHASQYMEKWGYEGKGSQSRSPSQHSHHSPSQQYFVFLRQKAKQAELAKCFGDAYKQFNSLKHSVYYYELANLYKLAAANQVIPSLISNYCRLVPEFNQVKSFACNTKPQQLQKQPEKLQSKIQAAQKLYRWSIDILNWCRNAHLSQSNQLKKLQQEECKYHLVSRDVARMVCFSQTQQIKQKYLSISYNLLAIEEHIVQNSGSQRLIKVQSQIEALQQFFKCSEDKILQLRIRMTLSPSFRTRNKYWYELEQLGEYGAIYKQIKETQGQNWYAYSFGELRMTLKYYFSEKAFERVLALARVLEDRFPREKRNCEEIYQLELQSFCQKMLLAELKHVLTFIKDKCLCFLKQAADESSSQDTNTLPIPQHSRHSDYSIFPASLQERTGFYLKMFRFIYYEFEFTRSADNKLFIETFKIYYLCIKGSKRPEYLSEALFYLLRFIIEKFYDEGAGYTSYVESIINDYEVHNLLPHVDYLIRRVGAHQGRNAMIRELLCFVAVKFPKESLWWLNSLVNHVFLLDTGSRRKEMFTAFDRELEDIGNYIVRELTKIGLFLSEQFDWITKFIKVNSLREGQNFLKLAVPPHIFYPFQPELTITSIAEVNKVGQGKSNPLQIVFKCQEKRMRVIKKYNQVNPNKNHRSESNTANFFAEIQILDKDITYSIFNLSKFSLLIEYISHSCSLKELTQNNPHVDQKANALAKDKLFAILERKNFPRKKLATAYSEIAEAYKYNLAQVFYEGTLSLKQWWERLNNFIRTTAQWSLIGYMVGLGDRHGQNILVKENFKAVHIDFEYALDQGLLLPLPEWVPFRLVRSMVEVMGALGPHGLFYAELVRTAKLIRGKQREIWKALSYFQQNNSTKIIQNIMNRVKFTSCKQSVQKGCLELIALSVDSNLLGEMFIGWGSYI